MSDAEFWLTAISTVGFPIVAFLLMFWLVTRIIRDNTAALIDLKNALEYLKHD